MSDKKISALTAATTPLAGTEVLPIVQSGVTKKVSVADLTADRPTSTGFLTVKANSSGNAVELLGRASDEYAWLAYKNTAGTVVNAEFGINNGKIFYGYVNGAEAYTINGVSGDIKVSTGNLVIGTSGKGIDFSASPSAGGMTSELLADYEEGTWTASLVLASGSVTYGSQFGKYVKVGNVVTANAWIALSAISSPTGDLEIPLPIATGATNIRPSTAVFVNNLTGVTGQIFAWVGPNAGRFYLRIGNNGSTSNLQGTNLASNSEIYVSITYPTF